MRKLGAPIQGVVAKSQIRASVAVAIDAYRTDVGFREVRPSAVAETGGVVDAVAGRSHGHATH